MFDAALGLNCPNSQFIRSFADRRYSNQARLYVQSLEGEARARVRLLRPARWVSEREFQTIRLFRRWDRP